MLNHVRSRIPPLIALLASLSAIALNGASAAEKHLTIGTRDVAMWEPLHIADRASIIVFSHGFGGCATQSRFLMEMLAAQGYWVFAPNHKDNRCGGSAENRQGRIPDKSFDAPRTWDATTYIDRAEDITAIVTALKQMMVTKDRIDFDRIGLVGYSLGGYTVLGLAGAWPGWRMPGIRAVLAFSPFGQPFQAHRTLGGLSAPVMYQGGTRDLGTTPALRRPGGIYSMSPSPKYYVEFKGAGHLAWGNTAGKYHTSINAYALAFFDRYLQGKHDSHTLTTRKADVSALYYQSELGEGTQ